MGPLTNPASDVSVVYERYANLLYRVAYSILMSKEDAEDAVSESFCKYLTKAPSFREAEHEKAWLLRVTVNQCHDMARKRGLRSYTPLEEITELSAQEPEQFSVLEDVMKLPEKYKTVLILHYYESMKIEEIATILKISTAAVKMRLNRGRDCLKNQWKGDEANV